MKNDKLIVTRKDLHKWSLNCELKDIEYTDFKNLKRDFEKANEVVFIDDDESELVIKSAWKNTFKT